MPTPNPYDALLEADAAAAPATPSNPYDALFEEDATRARARRAATLSTAVDTNPDAYATQKRVAGYLGYPVSAVAATPDASMREAKVKKVQDTSAGYPELQRHFENDDFARMAHDDVDTLAAIGGQLAKAAKYAFGANAPGKGGLASDLAGGAYYGGASGWSGVFRAAAEFGAAGAEGMIPALRMNEQLGVAGGNPLRRLAEGFGMLAEDQGARLKALTPQGEGIVGSGVTSGVQSLGQSLSMLPLALLPGGQGAALAGMAAPQGGAAHAKGRK
jgi:hypothetical protein